MKRFLKLSIALSFLFFASCGKAPIEDPRNANAQVGAKFTDQLMFGNTDSGAQVALNSSQSNSRGFYSNYSSDPYSNGYSNSTSYDPYTGSSTAAYTGSGYDPYNSSYYGNSSMIYSNPNVVNYFDPYSVASRFQTDPGMGAFLGFAGWVRTLAPNILSVIKVNIGQSATQTGSVCPAGYTSTASGCVFGTQNNCPTGYVSTAIGCVIANSTYSCPAGYVSTVNGCAALLQGISGTQGAYCSTWNLQITANQTLMNLRRQQFSTDTGSVQRVSANTFSITWQSRGNPHSGFVFVVEGANTAQSCNPYQSQFTSCSNPHVPLTLQITGSVTDCSPIVVPPVIASFDPFAVAIAANVASVATAAQVAHPVSLSLDTLVNDTSGTAPFIQQSVPGSVDEIRARVANFNGQNSNWFTY